uniref:Uncharacterized protein n=1 Tax=Siphoviridae sp. ctcPV5 TaxID=2827582 RepID=A0A8S5LL09_9CAUD|nr:MAG TPA: hypothetical protein [Siphoviridae sp. ctcPV5]
MKDKAYIVANKEQELEVLKNFEQNGFPWNACENAMSFVPSKRFNFNESNFPYILMITNDNIWWSAMKKLEDETIVYDGRKEEEMDNKYKVTQKFMNELIKWRDDERLNINTKGIIGSFLDIHHIKKIPDVVDTWWTVPENKIENNNRLIAIIKWLNGEDAFEVDKSHKFVVRSENTDADKYYTYVEVDKGITTTVYSFKYATNFDTREEAQEWANSHQVVVEIDEEGNEVE